MLKRISVEYLFSHQQRHFQQLELVSAVALRAVASFPAAVLAVASAAWSAAASVLAERCLLQLQYRSQLDHQQILISALACWCSIF